MFAKLAALQGGAGCQASTDTNGGDVAPQVTTHESTRETVTLSQLFASYRLLLQPQQPHNVIFIITFLGKKSQDIKPLLLVRENIHQFSADQAFTHNAANRGLKMSGHVRQRF